MATRVYDGCSVAEEVAGPAVVCPANWSCRVACQNWYTAPTVRKTSQFLASSRKGMSPTAGT